MTTATSQELLIRLLDPASRADPYPVYAQIRELGPLRIPEFNLTVFSSYQDCDDVLRHPSSASDFRKASPMEGRAAPDDDGIRRPELPVP